MPQATLTSKGQITIPKMIRNILKLDTGGKVNFLVLENGNVMLQPVVSSVDDVFGKLSVPRRRTATIREMDEGIRRKVRGDHR